MCGICGILNLNGASVASESVKRMTDAMAHRGPDDAGVYLDGNLGLGHRRLSIIDLSDAGHQPMFNEDRTMALVFNGEVYNFKELRKELESLGHRFTSRTDTEVVIHAYESWGERCVLRFNGMFAFGLWDSVKRQLFLARDRYGIKPLYYHEDDAALTFASEVKPILQQPNVSRRVCLGALDEYFTFQNVFTDRTLFEGIKMLPAGSFAIVGWDTEYAEITRYWDWDFSHTRSDVSFDEAAEETRRLFEQAVTRQLVSDVPVGGYLSGGMDSGSIVAVASRQLPHFLTFTGGFDLSSVSGLEAGFDEREPAELMASVFGSQHYEMVMHSGDMAWCLPLLTRHIEDLRMGMSYANWYVAHLASKFVKVVLSGAGGDELFAGYPWRYTRLLKAQHVGEFNQAAYQYWQRLIPYGDKPDFFTDDILSETEGQTASIFAEVLRPLGQSTLTSESALNRALYFEAKTFLHGLFIVEDRISMAQSIEVRVPFLDNDLVDFVLTLPAQYKMTPPDKGKLVLRSAMRGLVPDAILTRKKQGFSSPDENWYRNGSMDYVKSVLLDPKTLNRGYFQPDYIRKVVSEHAQGKVNHRLLIWSLLSFEHWNREFMDGQWEANKNEVLPTEIPVGFVAQS